MGVDIPTVHLEELDLQPRYGFHDQFHTGYSREKFEKVKYLAAELQR